MLLIGLGRAYRLGGDFEVTILVEGGGGGGKPKGDGTIFMGEVHPSRLHVKILIWQLYDGQVG